MKDLKTTSFNRPITFPYLTTFNGTVVFNTAIVFNTAVTFNGIVTFNQPTIFTDDVTTEAELNADGGINIPTSVAAASMSMDIGAATINMGAGSSAGLEGNITINNYAGIITVQNVSLNIFQSFRLKLTNSMITAADIILTNIINHVDLAAATGTLITSIYGIPVLGGEAFVQVASLATNFTNKEVKIGFMIVKDYTP